MHAYAREQKARSEAHPEDSGGGKEVETLWKSNRDFSSILEYKRLAHLILSIPFGSVENERRFSSMNLAHTKLRNRLQEEHLNVQLRAVASKLTPKTFPYREAYAEWKAAKNRRAVDK